MNRLSPLTPTERIHQLEAQLDAARYALSTLEVERDVLRSLLAPSPDDPPTLRLHPRLGELLPTTGTGAERTVPRLTRIGDILERRGRK